MTDPSEHATPARSGADSHPTGPGHASARARIEPLLFVGAGTMAQAIIAGAMKRGALDPARIIVVDPKPDRRALFDTIGVSTHETINHAIQALRQLEARAGEGQIVLAIKPQVLGEVAAELAPLIEGESRVVISILAGIPSDRIADALGDAVAGHAGKNESGNGRGHGRGNSGQKPGQRRSEPSMRVIRVMPNTPARIGQGMTAIAMGCGARAGDDALAQAIFAAVGEVVSIDETLMDAFTAVAGSGPAYVFYLAEAMSAAAVRLGFNQKQADLIVRKTIAGAGNLMVASPDEQTDPTDQTSVPLSPAALRAAVTSKNGTTYAATTRLDELGVMEAIITAVRAARDRGRELAQG